MTDEADKKQDKKPEKIKLVRRNLPDWMVYVICFASVMLLLASLLELPTSFRSGTGNAVLGVIRVLIWTGMTAIYVPDALRRLKETSDPMNLKAFAAWRQSKTGLLLFGVAELALAFQFVLFSIDSGSLLDYVITFLLVLVAISDFTKLAGLLRSKGRSRV